MPCSSSATDRGSNTLPPSQVALRHLIQCQLRAGVDLQQVTTISIHTATATPTDIAIITTAAAAAAVAITLLEADITLDDAVREEQLGSNRLTGSMLLSPSCSSRSTTDT
jgi:hypothetical protein